MSQQLDLVTRISCPADHFVIQGDRLYAGARYGEAHSMTIVDIADVTAPRVLSTLACRRQTSSVAVAGEVAFVGEYCRSILLVDVRDPAKPKPFDAIVSFKNELTHFQISNGVLAAAAGRRGVFALDVRDPWKARLLPMLPITGGTDDDKPDVEQLAMRDRVIYAAVRNVGCVILEVADGQLRERGRICPESYRVDHIVTTPKSVWMFGHSDDDEANLVVADRATGAIRFRGNACISKPETLVDVPGGGVGIHTHYTGSIFLDEETRIQQLFRQYETRDDLTYVEARLEVVAPDKDGDDDDGDDDDDDDAVQLREVHGEHGQRDRSCMDTPGWIVRHGDHLLAVHGLKDLIVWKPRAGSAFG